MTKARKASRKASRSGAAQSGRALSKAKTSPCHAFAQLQHTLVQKAHALRLLEREHERLEQRQSLLERLICQQEGIVHCLGRLLSKQMIRELQAADAADCPAVLAILHDARAYQLMLEAGGGSSSGSSGQPLAAAAAAAEPLYTTQVMASINPARVAQMRAMDVRAHLAPLMRDIAMRMSHMLQDDAPGGPSDGSLSEALAQKVDEFSELVLVLHAAADDKLHALGLLNFETCQEGLPAPGHLEAVTDCLGLSEAQAEQIARAFKLCDDKRAALIVQMHACVAQLAPLLAPNAPQCCELSVSTAVQPSGSASLAGSGTSLAAAACVRTSSSCSSLFSVGGEPSLAGGLRLAEMEQTQQVLEQLNSINGALRVVDRLLLFTAFNVLDKHQLARCIVFSYPWLCCQPAWAQVVFRRSKFAQQEAGA